MKLNCNNKILCKHGVNAAVIADYIWREKENTGFEIHKRKWLRCSRKQMTAVYPFLKLGSVDYAVNKLLRAGIINKGELNESKFDRTLSYSFTPYGKTIMESGEMYE